MAEKRANRRGGHQDHRERLVANWAAPRTEGGSVPSSASSGHKRRTQADFRVLIPFLGGRNSDDRRLDAHMALQKLDLLQLIAGFVAQNDTSAVSSGFAMR